MNCIPFFLLFLCSLQRVTARIHHLKLNDDRREQVTISTFGFLKHGFLQVRINKLQIDPYIQLQSLKNPFAFVLEKNQNRGFSSFSARPKNQDFCSLLRRSKSHSSGGGGAGAANETREMDEVTLLVKEFSLSEQNRDNFSLVIFHLDLAKQKANLIRTGSDLKNLKISSEFSNNMFGFNRVQPLVAAKNASGDSETDDDMSSYGHQNKPTLKTIDLDINQKLSYLSFKFEINISSASEEGLYLFNFYNCFQPDLLGRYDFQVKKAPGSNKSDGYDQNDEFGNQFKFGVNLDLELVEHNFESYLSAGELPLPTLYLTWSIIYFLAAISWMYILKSSKGGDVFKIHYLMFALVCLKSITLTFHAINMHYIAMNGAHEAIWAILYYITYVLRGLVLIISILLVGTGWTFIKHVLSENERRLFVIVIPLQILAIAAYIFLEENEQGDAVYLTWRKLFFLLDLICCGAILFPVVWSIKHLEQGSKTDGKVTTNLKKLKIFKHFYIMIICYIYFTRIIGFLLQQVIPFRYEWLDELCTEVVTFVFFALTAYRFQPASNNPYLQLSQEDYNEVATDEPDMEDVSETVFVAANNRSEINNRNKTPANVDVENEQDEDEVYTFGLNSGAKKTQRQYLTDRQ